MAFSVATALFGWLIALDGNYESALLERHRWLGIAGHFTEQQTNHRKISRWKFEIAHLEDRTREATVSANLGVSSETDTPPATELAETNVED